MHISKLVYNFRKLRKINVFDLKSSHLFDDFLVTQWHFMGICKCFFIIRVYKVISSTFSERRNSLNMLKSLFYPLINNIYLQLLTNYHFWPKRLLKRWLNLNLKTSVGYTRVLRYAIKKFIQEKNACNSKVNTGLSVQDDQKILKVHYWPMTITFRMLHRRT